jgi:hypothetical protein
MNGDALLTFIIVCVWLIVCVKTTYDHAKLVRVYQAKIDSTHPTSPFDNNLTILNPFSLTKKRLSMVFSKYPEHPDVDRLASRVRKDVVLMVATFVSIAIALAAFVLI